LTLLFVELPVVGMSSPPKFMNIFHNRQSMH